MGGATRPGRPRDRAMIDNSYTYNVEIHRDGVAMGSAEGGVGPCVEDAWFRGVLNGLFPNDGRMPEFTVKPVWSDAGPPLVAGLSVSAGEPAGVYDRRVFLPRMQAAVRNLIDTKQLDRLGIDVFTPDAVVDYTKAPGGIAGSVAEVTAWLAKVLAPFTVLQHMLGNFDIVVAGNRARSICYFHNPMGFAVGDGPLTMFWCGGRYVDELVRTPAGWRISHRIDDVQYMHGLPGAPA